MLLRPGATGVAHRFCVLHSSRDYKKEGQIFPDSLQKQNPECSMPRSSTLELLTGVANPVVMKAGSL